MDDTIEETHESYGLIGISHTTCNRGIPLFGSSIKHSNTIRIRIHRASVNRHLYQEWFHSTDRSVVEVELSPTQFSTFVTTPNVGEGVPCTIRYIDGKQMEDPPYKGQNETFNTELKEKFSMVLSDAESLINDSKEMLNSKGPMKVGDKKTLLGKLNMLVQNIKSNLPFLHTQFTRSMDKTVVAAKAEIEEFYTSTIMKLGKKALEDGNLPNRPEIEHKSEV